MYDVENGLSTAKSSSISTQTFACLRGRFLPSSSVVSKELSRHAAEMFLVHSQMLSVDSELYSAPHLVPSCKHPMYQLYLSASSIVNVVRHTVKFFVQDLHAMRTSYIEACLEKADTPHRQSCVCPAGRCFKLVNAGKYAHVSSRFFVRFPRDPSVKYRFSEIEFTKFSLCISDNIPRKFLLEYKSDFVFERVNR